MMDDDAPYDIRICRESDGPVVDQKRLRDAVVRALRRAGRKRAHISIALVGDQRMAHLNEQYLGHQGPTDVLSFDLSDVDGSDVDGEVVISTDTAVRQAIRRGHDPTAEILLYAIHGTLHLCGMNDGSEADAGAMHRTEDELLTEMGVGAVFGRPCEPGTRATGTPDCPVAGASGSSRAPSLGAFARHRDLDDGDR